MHENRVFTPHQAKYLGYLVLCAAFVAVGAVLAGNGAWEVWLGVLFFGAGAVVFAVLLLPRSAYLRIGPEGFTICSLFRARSLRWADVDTFQVATFHQQIGSRKMVVFNFSPHYQGSRRGHKLAVAISGYAGGLPDTYGMRPEELANLLNEYRRRYTAPPGV